VKTLLALAMLTLFVGVGMVPAAGQDHIGSEVLGDRFVGAWRLAWLEEQGADGKIQRADCIGLLVYTRDGHMSVQVMYRNPQASIGAAPVEYAQGGYEASFGTYSVDDSHTFTFHVEGALVRTLVGKDLKRVYEMSGKQLIVKSSSPNEHWRVAWER